MIYTVTLNPGIDYLAAPDRLKTGAINRFSTCSYGPGGKGINVSQLLTSLGVENTALGIAAGFTGREIVRLMEEMGCKTDFVFLSEGNSRINIKICPGSGEETDLNGEGPAVPPAAMEELSRKLDALRDGDSLVLAGSIPASLPVTVYAQLLEQAAGKDVRTVVDAADGALTAALPLRPFLIKPNLEELSSLFQREVSDVETARECARELQRRGARNVAVSMGERGAMLLCEDGPALFSRPIRGKAVSTVGAGDSMVAGMLYGWQLHGTAEGALRWGTAAGAATAFAPGIASGASVRELFPLVENICPI